MITDRQMKDTLMIELFSTTGLFLSVFAYNLQQFFLGVLFACIYAVYFLWIRRYFQPESCAKILKCFYTVRFFCYACFLCTCIRILVEENLLQKAGNAYLVLPVLFLAIYANQGGRKNRGRMMEVLIWYIFLPLFLVLFLALKEVKPVHLIEGGFSLKASIQVFLCFSSVEILLFFEGRTKEKCKALLFVLLSNLFLFAVTIGMYGAKLVQQSDFPTATTVQMVRFPGSFVERLDIFMIAFWILSLFTVFSAYCFYGTSYHWKKDGFISTVFYMGVGLFGILYQGSLRQLLESFQLYLIWLDIPAAILLPLAGLKNGKKTTIIALLTALTLIVTGCLPNRVGIEERAYVLALYVDEKKDRIEAGYFLPDSICVKVEGKNWKELGEKFQKSSEKKLELGHLKAIVLGNSSDRLKKHLLQKQELTKTILLFETEESLKSLMERSKDLDRDLGNFLVHLAEENKKEVTLGQYFSEPSKLPKLRIRTKLLILE